MFQYHGAERVTWPQNGGGQFIDSGIVYNKRHSIHLSSEIKVNENKILDLTCTRSRTVSAVPAGCQGYGTWRAGATAPSVCLPVWEGKRKWSPTSPSPWPDTCPRACGRSVCWRLPFHRSSDPLSPDRLWYTTMTYVILIIAILRLFVAYWFRFISRNLSLKNFRSG